MENAAIDPQHKGLEYRICLQNHPVPYAHWNFAKDFSSGDVDVMTRQPMYEPGLYCSQCKQAYGISKLKEPEPVAKH